MPRRPAEIVGARVASSYWRLKNCTARSCFSAAARFPNVPRFLRRPVFGSFFREYSLYSPDFSFLIIAAGSTQLLDVVAFERPFVPRRDAPMPAAVALPSRTDVRALSATRRPDLRV
jgi:hypothetical protein